MALDIPALTQAALVKAWTIAESVLVVSDLRDAPTQGTYDPATDTRPVTWTKQALGIKILFWKKSVREDADLATVAGKRQMAMARLSDCPGFDTITEKAELVDADGIVWKVIFTDIPPGNKFVIFTLRK